MPSAEARGRWMVLAAAFLWGTTATLARHLFRDLHIPALTVVEMRLVVAVALLGGGMALWRPAALRIRGRDAGYLVVLGLAGVAAMQGSYYYNISVLGVALAILLQYLAPSLIVLWEIARGRRPDTLTVLGVIGALTGAALVVGHVDPRAVHATPWQWGLGFGSAFVWAFYIVFSKRALRTYPPGTVLLWTFAIAAIFWAVVTPPWVILGAGYPPSVWGMFLVLGIASTLVPFGLLLAGLRHLGPAETGILATTEPAIAVVSAWVLLGEGLNPVQWLGAALVLVASVLASRRAPDAVLAEAERA